jgi:hypothetical protein
MASLGCMRNVRLLALASIAIALPAHADEVIYIHGHLAEPADGAQFRQISRDPRALPPYSDEAILSNTWVTAWLLLDLDSGGSVTRIKVLNAPGHDLDSIAVDRAFNTQFSPALDDARKAVRSRLVWGIEWPSYYWMLDCCGTALRLPHQGSIGDIQLPPCRGTGPLQLGSMRSTVYRDCSLPNLAHAEEVAWIYPGEAGKR